MSHIDLNLIRTFITLYEARSVTLAAERLFVTQPSVSYGLARLRELFDDKLFSRTRDGIQPTFVAQQLYPTLRDCLTRIEGAVQTLASLTQQPLSAAFALRSRIWVRWAFYR